MNDQDTLLQQVLTAQPDPTKWIRRGRGYVDWSFSQVAQYLGYTAALEYVGTMHRWHDFEARYKECELEKSYQRYKTEIQKHENEGLT